MDLTKRANRQVCDCDIRLLSTKEPVLFFDTANVTTVGLTGDSVFAMAKGTKRIAFQNPMEGTLTIEAQVYPFQIFSLLTNGTVATEAVIPVKKTITASGAGTLAIADTNGTITTGSIFVYPAGKFGDASAKIAGTYASGTFTATTTSDIAASTSYDVGYLLTRSTGVDVISFKNSSLPRDYTITMETLDKDDQGYLTPFYIKVFKASAQRNWELSFNSEGDPASITLTFDVLEDEDGNMIDMVEITGDKTNS